MLVTKAVLNFDSNESNDRNGAEPCYEYKAIVPAPVPDQEAGVEATKNDKTAYNSRNDDPSQEIWNVRVSSKLHDKVSK